MHAKLVVGYCGIYDNLEPKMNKLKFQLTHHNRAIHIHNYEQYRDTIYSWLQVPTSFLHSTARALTRLYKPW